VQNFDGPSGIDYVFQSQPINASGLNALAVQFDYAFSRTDNSNNDLLLFQVSTNCGQTWVTRRTLSNTSLITTSGLTTDHFVPDASEWKTALIDNFTSTHYIDGLLMRFIFRSGGGNNMYIDNINISHPNILSISNSLNDNSDIYLFPNPSQNNVLIKGFEADQNVQLKVYDPTGRLVVDETELMFPSHYPSKHSLKVFILFQFNTMAGEL
jgi:hypothetical protein